MKTSFKIILIVLAVIVGMYLLLKIALVIFINQKFSRTKTPALYVTSKIFDNFQKVDTSKAELIKYKNFSFSIPINNQYTKEETEKVFKLKKDKSHVISILPVDSGANSLTDLIATNKTKELVDKVYGNDATLSEFKIKKAIYSSRPTDINLFSGFNKDIVTYYTLILKNVMLPTSKGNVYIIENKHYQGLYTPDSKTGRGPIELYDKSGKQIATIVISNASQQEISYLISTLRVE